MKNIFSLLTLLFLTFECIAQNKYTLTIKDTKGNYLPNVEVTATNLVAKDILKAKTNASGKVIFDLTKVGVYTFSYLEMKDVDTYTVEEGAYGSGGRTVTYDPKKTFVKKPIADRTGIAFTSVPGTQLKGKPGISQLTIAVESLNHAAVMNTLVDLVSISEKTKYTGKTNGFGEAVFNIPAGKTYEVDVEGIPAIKVITVSNDTKMMMTEFVFYEKTKINETIKGDTIFQKDISQATGTNTHWLFTMRLVNYENEPLNGEPVFLVAQGKKRVYCGFTDLKGECNLLVEKTADYVVNLKYEQGLHLVEVSKTVGFGKGSVTRRYRGSKEIERIVAEQAAEMKRIAEEDAIMKLREEDRERLRKLTGEARAKELKAQLFKKKQNELKLVESFYAKNFVPTFNETPVRPAPAPKDYVKTIPGGYAVEFSSAGDMGTPTIVNDQLFTPAGFYSPSYYCLNALNGKYIWGLELGESGASPGVYHNGVILINTYSCTLYAIDAATGKLLWSKWLSGTVYSTPTADGDKVYVVYRYGDEFVLSCFDLRSGAFKWINRVDSETIACPVVAGAEVHVASQTGFYYVFDKTTGKPINVVTSISAVSSPTITPTGIYITAQVDGKDRLVELDRKTFEVKKTYPASIFAQNSEHAGDCMDQMNFNGAHPVVYKNKYVVLSDENSVKVMDAQSERMIWEKPFKGTTNQVPIVADDKVILGSADGKVVSFDLATGDAKTLHTNGKSIDSQPVAHKGKLFFGSGGLLLVVPLLQNFSWNQWNKDAGHNLYVP